MYSFPIRLESFCLKSILLSKLRLLLQVVLYLPLCSICHCLHCGSHNLIFTESFRLPLDETFHKSAQDGCRVLGPGHDCAGTQAPWDPTPRTHARHRNLDPRRDKNEPLAGMKVELCRNRIMHTTNTYVRKQFEFATCL